MESSENVKEKKNVIYLLNKDTLFYTYYDLFSLQIELSK